eukprot:TRINITY_DN757_c0_g1_i1.p1 TRINITY_DN757_c0_g1~~TRINITY_DN757_c0_g1_i1.p1  ORF type:complete len:659 (+),score=150.51 TRINITY_DN757_c0_g1_i1:257-1978(+)
MGHTPLDVTIGQNDLTSLRKLLELGARPHLDSPLPPPSSLRIIREYSLGAMLSLDHLENVVRKRKTPGPSPVSLSPCNSGPTTDAGALTLTAPKPTVASLTTKEEGLVLEQLLKILPNLLTTLEATYTQNSSLLLQHSLASLQISNANCLIRKREREASQGGKRKGTSHVGTGAFHSSTPVSATLIASSTLQSVSTPYLHGVSTSPTPVLLSQLPHNSPTSLSTVSSTITSLPVSSVPPTQASSSYSSSSSSQNWSTGTGSPSWSLPSTTSQDLEECDWQFLLSIAEIRTYTQSETIIKQGVYNRVLYRVRSGQVRIEKGNKFVAMLEPTQILGEMSLVDRDGFAAATAVAQSERVEVYVLPGPLLFRLMSADSSGLALRFFRFVGAKIAYRLRDYNLHLLPSANASTANLPSNFGSGAAGVESLSTSFLSSANNVGADDDDSTQEEDEEEIQMQMQQQPLPLPLPPHDHQGNDALLMSPSLVSFPNTPVLPETPESAPLKVYACRFKIFGKDKFKKQGNITISKQFICLVGNFLMNSLKETIQLNTVTSLIHQRKSVLIATVEKVSILNIKY